MRRKGISPIIASVLLIAVVISVTAIFSNWAPEMVESVTEGVEDQTSSQIECNEAGIELYSVNYNNGEAEVVIRNTGGIELEDDVILAAFDSEDSLITQETGITVSSSELSNVTMTDIAEDPEYLQAYSQSCSDVSGQIEI